MSVGFDLTNLWPRRLPFKRSGLLAIAAAVLFVPWLWYDDSGAITMVLGAIGATMGPVTGILLVDFYVVRRRRYDVDALFSRTGKYRYRGGWNPAAVVAFALGAFVALVGLAPPLSWLYAYNWFLGVGVGAVTYLLLMLPATRRTRQ